MATSDEITGLVPATVDITIRSQQPDVIVSVGSDKEKQEFKCYKVMLSFASNYLDAMLSSSMREGMSNRIEFPNKLPEEWELFYEIITPQNIGKPRIATDIHSGNVMTLLPWFHEFQMIEYVIDCDNYLAKHYISDDGPSFWEQERHANENLSLHLSRLKRRQDKLDMILDVLKFAHMYDLASAKDAMEKKIADLWNMKPFTYDLFDFPIVKSLLLPFLPFEIDDEHGLRMAGGESKHLWPLFENIISPHTSRLSQSVIGDIAYFPHLFYSFMLLEDEKSEAQDRERAEIKLLKNKKLKAKEPKKSTTKIIKNAMNALPHAIDTCRLYLKHKNDLKNICIAMP